MENKHGNLKCAGCGGDEMNELKGLPVGAVPSDIEIAEERLAELVSFYNHETSDDGTQDWRDELDPDEEKIVAAWDMRFRAALLKLFETLKPED